MATGERLDHVYNTELCFNPSDYPKWVYLIHAFITYSMDLGHSSFDTHYDLLYRLRWVVFVGTVFVMQTFLPGICPEELFFIMRHKSAPKRLCILSLE